MKKCLTLIDEKLEANREWNCLFLFVSPVYREGNQSTALKGEAAIVLTLLLTERKIKFFELGLLACFVLLFLRFHSLHCSQFFDSWRFVTKLICGFTKFYLDGSMVQTLKTGYSIEIIELFGRKFSHFFSSLDQCTRYRKYQEIPSRLSHNNFL